MRLTAQVFFLPSDLEAVALASLRPACFISMHMLLEINLIKGPLFAPPPARLLLFKSPHSV